MPAQPIRTKSATTNAEAESRLDREYLQLEISGETWYILFDTLGWIPRVGETIQVTGRSRGTVTQVEYEFMPESAPVQIGEAIPADLSYARPRRILVKTA